MKRQLVGFLAMVMLCSSVLLAQGPAPDKNPILGTWKQNLQKSTYDPGPPPPSLAFSVRQYSEADDGSILAITMNVSPDGIPSLGSISPAKYDGKEYQQHNLTTLSHILKETNRTISYNPIDHLTVEIVQKQDREVVSKSTRTISRDGRTMTERFTIVAGQPVNNVLIFEKQ